MPFISARVAARLTILASAVLGCMTPALAEHKDVAPLPVNVIDKIVDPAYGKPTPWIQRLQGHLRDLKQIAQGDRGESQDMLIASKRQELLESRKEVMAEIEAKRDQARKAGSKDQVLAWDDFQKDVEKRFKRVEKVLDVKSFGQRGQRAKALQLLRSELHSLHRDDGDDQQLLDGQRIWGTAEPLAYAPPVKSSAAPAYEMGPKEPVRYAMAGHTLIYEMPEKRADEPQRFLPIGTLVQAYAQKTALNYSLPNTSKLRASREGQDDVVGPLMFAEAPATPAEAASCQYVPADLAATADVPSTAPEIKQLAEKLAYSPAKIFQYVYKNIRFEPYYGSMKGGLATLKSKSGGPTDQASLLIALLRASNIPARYVKGNVSVTDFQSDPSAGRVGRWIGAQSYGAVSNILKAGQFPSTTALSNGVSFNHVWAEACLPYGHYRGADIDKSGERWLPLDPSFRDRSYQPGITMNEVFDYQTFLSKRRDSRGLQLLVQEAYAEQVQNTVRRTDSNATVQDVPYTGIDMPVDFDVLPGSLPYQVNSYVNWTNTSSPEIAQLPEEHRYRLYVSDIGINLSTPYEIALPDLALKRLTLGFNYKNHDRYAWEIFGGNVDTDVEAGVNQRVHEAFDQYRRDGVTNAPFTYSWDFGSRRGHITYNTICVAHVQPILLLDGAPQTFTSSATTASGAMYACQRDIWAYFRIGLREVGNGQTGYEDTKIGLLHSAKYKNISPLNWYAIVPWARQGGDAVLADRAANVIKAVNSISSPNASDATIDATKGAFLDLIGLKYMRYISDAALEIGALKSNALESGPHIGLTATRTFIEYVFDLPFAITGSGFLIDVQGQVRPAGIKAGLGFDTVGAVELSTYAASLYESYIWQENAKLDAVSTVRGLQYASEKGIGYVTLNSANWDAKRPELQVADASAIDDCSYVDAGLKYSRCQIDMKASEEKQADKDRGFKSIRMLVDEGKEVTLPKTRIDYENKGEWKGMLYASADRTNNKYVMSIDAAGGGYTVGRPLFSNSFSYLSQNTFRPLSTSLIPSYYNSNSAFNSVPLTRSAANGYSNLSILSGDPVNMVSGNLFHNETDLSIKGRAGMDIVLTRGYNSRKPEDGPFGFGWTHSFNAYLKFYGVEDGKAKLSWVDGTGNERFFRTTLHTSGNLTVGSTIPNPTGVFLTFKRLADGTFSILEKNGQLYTFASATGPSGVPGTSTTPTIARLTSITDRNGNTLTLSYAATSTCGGGTLLCKVTDALNRGLSFDYTSNRITQVKDHTGRAMQYAYGDGKGNLTEAKNPLVVAGKQAKGTQYSYYTAADGSSMDHLMRQYTLPRGNGMRFEYYANARVFRHTVVRRDGSLSPDEVNLFTYNDFRRESVQTNERGAERRFFFDPYGNPIRVIDESGAEHHYRYDCIDPTVDTDSDKPEDVAKKADCRNPYNRISDINPAGYETKTEYDDNGNVKRVIPPRGEAAATESYDYNDFGQPRRMKDGKNQWAITRFDAKGNVTDQIRTKQGYVPASCATAECAFPSADQIVSWTVNGYDTVGNLTSSKKVRDFAAQLASNTATSDTGPLISYTYDANKLNVATMSRFGRKNAEATSTTVNSVTFGYDALDRKTSGVDGDWYPTSAKYDEADRVYQGTDKLGKLRTFRFDDNGNATGNSLEASVNGVATVVDSSASRFDDSDRVEASLDAGGFATQYTYDPAGNVVSTMTPDGYSTGFTYDMGNRPLTAFDQKGNGVTTVLDTSGRKRSVTDANGNKTTYGYWDASRDGRLKSVTQPKVSTIPAGMTGPILTNGRSVETDYDEVGNAISVTEVPAVASNPSTPGGNLSRRVTLTSFDELNRPVRVTGPQYTDVTLGAVCPVTTRNYNALGQLTWVKAGYTPSPCTNSASDVVKLQQSHEYDDFGRKTKTTDALSRSWTFVYDANNNLKTSTDSKNQTTTYEWDTGHQLKSRTDHAGRLTVYTRNAIGQVTSVSNPEATYTYRYDNAHRLLSVVDSRGNKRMSYDWSPGGLLNSVTDDDGRKTVYTWDPVGRLAGITAPNGETVAYQFDPAGRLLQRTMPGGRQTVMTYNEDNSLRQVLNYNGASSIVSQHDFVYDGVGNRLRQNERVGGSTLAWLYTYDELHRLTQADNATPAQLEKYQYDPLNNRTSKSVGQTAPVVTAYKFDDANELTEIRNGSLTGTLQATITYDDNGNIKNDGTRTYTWDVLDQLSAVTNGTTTVNYAYNHDGQRIRKTVDGVITNWLYDGQDIYADYDSAWSMPRAVYTSGGGTDDPVIRADVTGRATYGPAQYYYADALGSVVAVGNSSDTTVQTQRFDVWGNKLAGGNVDQKMQYGFTGREPDETGLMYYQARYYSPSIGRFVSRDPIGLEGGINAYAYVNDNPVNATDPDGLMPQSAFNRGVAGLMPNYFDRTMSALGMGGNYSLNGTRVRNANNVANAPSLGAVVDFMAGFIPGYDLLKAAFNPSATRMDLAVGMLGAIPGGVGRLAAVEVKAAASVIRAEASVAARGEAAFFRGARAGEAPSFVPRPNDFKVDPRTGFVKDTHGVSVFDNPGSVSSKGFVPHRVDQSSVPDSLRIIQRGSDPHHFEITPMPGANLTPQQFINACSSIVCMR